MFIVFISDGTGHAHHIDQGDVPHPIGRLSNASVCVFHDSDGDGFEPGSQADAFFHIDHMAVFREPIDQCRGQMFVF